MFRLLKLNNVPIFEQLKLEEALLRASNENWCLINTGSPHAIVMGISGKPEKLLDLKKVAQENIPVIRRFSGGGTVYVDSHTLFVTLIGNSTILNLPMQPKPILSWSEKLYQPLFKGFSLRENDYVFGDKKFGGNAQYLQKERWLLHTSFLWDYTPEKMSCLLLPEKRPSYRGERTHSDFLCTLRQTFPMKEQLVEQLATHFRHHLNAQEMPLEEALKIIELPHRQATTIVESHQLWGHNTCQ